MTAPPSPHLDALDGLDDLIKQLQCGSYIEARERNPFAGPMTLIEPGVASKAAAALTRLRERVAALEEDRIVISEEGQKDYDGMRDMQAKYIKADHARIAAEARVAELEAEKDALLGKPLCGHRGFAGPTCCVLVKDHAGEHKYGDPEQITIARVIRERDALRADAERLLEPTEEMIVAGVKTLLTGHDSQRHYVVALWRRMFYAARKEKP